MKQLNFGKKEYEKIESAIVGKSGTIEKENGFLYCKIIDESRKNLYFEFNTDKYYGSLEFLFLTDENELALCGEEYQIFVNEIYEKYNENIRAKIEWLIKEFIDPEFTLTEETKEETEMEKRINAGYEIIDSTEVPENREIVMGYNPESEFYVCWYYNIENDDYYWGTYSEDYTEIRDKYQERIAKTTYTPGRIFEGITACLRHKKLIPDDDFIDYVLPDDWEKTPVGTGEIFVECNLNYGDSEGIYLDVYLQFNDEPKRVNAGTIKTLETDRDAMYKMAKLEADILVEGSDWIWKHYDELEKYK